MDNKNMVENILKSVLSTVQLSMYSISSSELWEGVKSVPVKQTAEGQLASEKPESHYCFIALFQKVTF